MLCCAVLCCAVLCCAVLCCAVLCCAVLCWAGPGWAGLWVNIMLRLCHAIARESIFTQAADIHYHLMTDHICALPSLPCLQYVQGSRCCNTCQDIHAIALDGLSHCFVVRLFSVRTLELNLVPLSIHWVRMGVLPLTWKQGGRG